MTTCKRLMALCLALVMALSLCACGQKEEPTPEAPAPLPTPEPSPAPVPDPEPDKPAQPDTPEVPTPDLPAPTPTPVPDPVPPAPDVPTNSDGAKCTCGNYLTDWACEGPVCGQVAVYERLCPGCGTRLTREEFVWHTVENGACTRCDAREADPAHLQFKLTEDGTGYNLIRVTYEHTSPDLIVPRSYNGLPVVGVEGLSVDRQDNLQPYYIYLPETVTTLGEEAFQNLKIRAVWMPDSLETISTAAFLRCKSLRYLRFGTGLRTLGEAAFAQDTSLTAVTLPEGLVNLGSSAFSGCTNLKQINIPASVTAISEECFYDCLALKDVTWHQGIRIIGAHAFAGSGLTELPLLSGLESLGKGAFKNCRSLAAAALPQGLIQIHDEAFLNCDKMTACTLPDSLLRVGKGAFSGCRALKMTALPANLRIVGDEAFENCYATAFAGLPGGLTAVGKEAFDSAGFGEYLTVPASLIHLGERAFYGMRGVKYLRFQDEAACYDYSSFGSADLVWVELPVGNPSAVRYVWSDNKTARTVVVPAALTGLTPDQMDSSLLYDDATLCFRASREVAAPNDRLLAQMEGKTVRFEERETPDFPAVAVSAAPLPVPADGYTCSQGHPMTDWELLSRDVGCHGVSEYHRFCPTCGQEALKSDINWHNMVEDRCTLCGIAATAADLLKFELNDAGTGYIFTGVVSSFKSSMLIIPERYQGLPVVEVKAFGKPSDSLYKLRTVYLPEGVTKVHPHASSDCNLYQLYLPDSLTELPTSMCSGGAKYLSNLRLGRNVRKIGGYNFTNNWLTWVDLPETLEEVGEKAFVDCKELAGARPGPNVILGSQAFAGTKIY